MNTKIEKSNSLICLFCDKHKTNIYYFSIRTSLTYERKSIHICGDCLVKNIPELAYKEESK